LVQIKSHAQKVLKRLDVGENVFRRLEDNSQRLETLVVHIHEQLGLESPPLNNFSASSSSLNEQQQQLTRRRPNEQGQEDKVAEHSIRPNNQDQEDNIAASALCQLAAPAGAWGTSNPGSALPFPKQNQHEDTKAEFHSVVAAVNWIQP
jgi:hypothetical protein